MLSELLATKPALVSHSPPGLGFNPKHLRQTAHRTVQWILLPLSSTCVLNSRLNSLAQAVRGSSPFPTAPASPSCCGGTVMNAANIAAGPAYLLCRHEAASDAHSHLMHRSSLNFGQLHLSENQQELFCPSFTPLFSLRAWSPDAAALVLLFSFFTMTTENPSK